MEPLADTGAVIDALGGTYAVSQIFGCRMQNVSNWRKSGYFPPDTFETFSRELVNRGLTALLSLWRTIPTAQLAVMTIIPSEVSTTGAVAVPAACFAAPRSTADLAVERAA